MIIPQNLEEIFMSSTPLPTMKISSPKTAMVNILLPEIEKKKYRKYLLEMN